MAQNARQEPDDYYAYTQYDPLGRVTEAGEIKNTTAMTEATAQDDGDLASWLNTLNIRDRIVTTYDFPCDSTSEAQFPGGKQEHLRGRVACVKCYDEDNTLVYATHYSYDIHGNVHTLIQDVPELAHLGQQYKIITYDYDLISGNVEQVNYQPGETDAFYHRYEYDADNRIVTTYTSPDSVIWDRDARYAYYQHGPRARSLVGEEKVQGLDYYYNLQGWLVGVNSNTLHEGRDPGKDGFEPITGMPKAYQSTDTDIHATVARDAMGFSLRYHSQDYENIGGFNNAQQARALDADLTGHRNLYNGNINHMVTALRDSSTGNASVQQTQYHYDQLNRITQMQVFRATNLLANNSWTGASSSTDYKSQYTYDPNGNLLSLIRNGASPGSLGMDSLTYRYLPGSNRLDHVDDGVADANYTLDVDDQDSLNYEYDAIGNLIADEAEEIDEIIWNVGGKIRHIKRSPASTKPDLEFRYGPDGNRYCKIVKPDGSDEDEWVYTYYFRDASGNIMATYQRSYTDPDSLPATWTSTSKSYTEIFATQEYPLYGSARLGIFHQTDSLRVIAFNSTGFDTDGTFLDKTSIDTLSQTAPSDSCGIAFPRGGKRYELSNHLGNVLAVISDRKLQVLDANMTLGHYFTADIWSSSDYYPFGMTMGGRSWSQSSYRFGFQGQETEQEFYGGAVSYKYRVHDPRIGRFLSIDPLAPEYPHYSPYMFSGNRVIDMVELEGLEPEKDDPEYGFHIVLGGPQHEAAISNERVQLFDKSETNSNWIYREAKSLTMANQQIQNLREEMGDKWNKPVDVMLSTHGFTNAILGAGVPGMYLPLEFMEGAVQISNIHIDSYLEGDEGWVNILANKGSSPSVQQVAEIKALENLMASLPEGSNLILSACIVCSGDPEEDVLGKSLVELGKGRINIFLQTNFSINPVDEKATEFTEEAFENIRYLNVPLSIPKYVRDVENSGFVKFHRDGSGAKYLKKDLMLNSSDQPAFDTTDLNEN